MCIRANVHVIVYYFSEGKNIIKFTTYAPPSPLLKNRVDPSPKNRHGMGTMMYMSAAAQV
jgi:hypothetical protein